jgi:biuret amidohydrolase
MQYRCVHPDYGLGPNITRKPEMAQYFYSRVSGLVIPNIKRLLTHFREHKLSIVYVVVESQIQGERDLGPLYRDVHDAMEVSPRHAPVRFYKGTKEVAILKELEPLEGEIVSVKHSLGAMASSDLDPILRYMGIDTLIITGVSTNACVESTTREAADRAYKCILVEDATAAKTESFHRATITNACLMFGRVLTTDEVVAEVTAIEGSPVASRT